jgi:hypothetical protein
MIRLSTKIPLKVVLSLLGGGLVAAFLFFLVQRAVVGRQKGALKAAKPSISLPKKEINRELSIELKGREKIKINYLIESAELTGEIFVRGEKVKASSEKAFLLFNLKIVNSGKQGIQINSRDFVRLSSVKSEEWLAPEIHNDPVEVQAISTKFTRIGFPVSRLEKQFKVRLGEINGQKAEFGLSF